MLREGVAIGTIQLRRAEVRSFNDKQIALLKTFAAQAVIAIENTRLFNELRESLQQQTATADVLKVISTSPTQVQPVFEAMVARAAQLCEAHFSAVARSRMDFSTWSHSTTCRWRKPRPFTVNSRVPPRVTSSWAAHS
jgi:hypothetical protein